MSQVGYVGLKPGQYLEYFVPAPERFRWLYGDGQTPNMILREATPNLTSIHVCPLHQAQVREPSPTEDSIRTCARDGCDAELPGDKRRKVCDACRTSPKTTT